MIIVPIALIALVVLFLGAGLFKALQINIMPIFSMLFLVLGVMGIVFAIREDKKFRPAAIVFSVICVIIFLCTLGSSASAGDIISWIWYHI